MRILVIGASGFLGSHIYNHCRNIGINVEGTSSSLYTELVYLDVTRPESITQTIERSRPTSIINCAAITNVDECEKKPSLAMAVNAEGAGSLARVCEKVGARLVHVSTDSVFDGKVGGYKETCETNPINTYSRTKVRGEQLVSAYQNHVIARTNFYGLDPNGKHLLNWIISSLQQDREMIGFDDVFFNPLWVKDLAVLLVELAISSTFCGIIHCAGDQQFTKYEFIRQVAFRLGYNNPRIRRGSSNQIAFLAPRPKNTTLVNGMMHSLLKTKIQTLDEVICDTSFNIYRAQESEKV